MTKFVFIYHAPQAPADAPPPDSAQMEAMMAEWMAWAGRVGDGLIDLGTPLGVGARVTQDGISDSDREVAGYSIIEADSREDALAFATSHPHLNMPGGCEIEVHESQPIPGM